MLHVRQTRSIRVFAVFLAERAFLGRNLAFHRCDDEHSYVSIQSPPPDPVADMLVASGGGAKFSTMAPSKFALRALSQVRFFRFPFSNTAANPDGWVWQSLAREFGPKGVHVAHVIVDGLIDTERVKGMAGEAEPGSRLDPEAIGKVCTYYLSPRPARRCADRACCQAYHYLYSQDPSAWTQELDLRYVHLPVRREVRSLIHILCFHCRPSKETF